MSVTESTFDSNTAEEAGGAIAVITASANDTYIIEDSAFVGNSAGGEGGGAVVLLVDAGSGDVADVGESVTGSMILAKWVFCTSSQSVGQTERTKS